MSALSSTTMLGNRDGGGATAGILLMLVALAVVEGFGGGGGGTEGRTGAGWGCGDCAAPTGGIPINVGVRAAGAGRLARLGTLLGVALGGFGMLTPAGGGGIELGCGGTGASSRTITLRPVISTGSCASSSSTSPSSMTSTRLVGLGGASGAEPLVRGSSDCPDMRALDATCLASRGHSRNAR
jgi:hypothetical protein